jgi:multiple sugar transport system permease protein
MLAPFVLLFTVFTIYPMIRSLYLSLTDYSGIPRFQISDRTLKALARDRLSAEQIQALEPLKGEEFKNENLMYNKVRKAIGKELADQYRPRLVQMSKLPPRFVGIRNYVELVTNDIRFRRAVRNMAAYVPIAVLLNGILGLCLAIIFKGEGLFKQVIRILFFLPSVTSEIAVLIIWKWVFTAENYGLANTVISWFGGERITFLANPAWTMRVLLIITAWGGMGYTMILFLAGLNSISPSYYEAAAIDGANEWDSFWRITLPLLRPVLLYVVITGMISAFQIFTSVYVLFGSTESIGGVLDSMLMIVPYLYDNGFRLFKLGYASSIAWVLFALIFIVTMINLYFGRRKEAEQ